MTMMCSFTLLVTTVRENPLTRRWMSYCEEIDEELDGLDRERDRVVS
jgi:hypothetical protein